MKITLAPLLTTLLLACQPTPPAEALLDDYLTRLSRVLDVERPPVADGVLPRMPPPRELQVTIERLDINLLDFWGFRRCGLAEVLGERNSVLGRVMVPSQHLHMDGRILQQLRFCINTLEDDKLVALARSLEAQKHQQWPARYWNATAAGPELRAFWTPATTPLLPGGEASYQEAETALAFLATLPDQLAENQWPERTELEAHYKALEQYALGGKLLQSLALGYRYTHAANQMLESAREQQTLCPAGLQRRELDYARNVMVKVFIGEVQPWLAAVNRRTSSLTEQYRALLKSQAPELRPTINPFVDSVTEQHHQFQNALREHVDLWKQLFRNCGSQAIP